MKLHKVFVAALGVMVSFAALAQIGWKPPPFSPSTEGGDPVSAAEIGKSRAPEPCQIKPVMTDEELKRCGARPPVYTAKTPTAPAPKK